MFITIIKLIIKIIVNQKSIEFITTNISDLCKAFNQANPTYKKTLILKKNAFFNKKKLAFSIIENNIKKKKWFNYANSVFKIKTNKMFYLNKKQSFLFKNQSFLFNNINLIYKMNFLQYFLTKYSNSIFSKLSDATSKSPTWNIKNMGSYPLIEKKLIKQNLFKRNKKNNFTILVHFSLIYFLFLNKKNQNFSFAKNNFLNKINQKTQFKQILWLFFSTSIHKSLSATIKLNKFMKTKLIKDKNNQLNLKKPTFIIKENKYFNKNNNRKKKKFNNYLINYFLKKKNNLLVKKNQAKLTQSIFFYNSTTTNKKNFFCYWLLPFVGFLSFLPYSKLYFNQNLQNSNFLLNKAASLKSSQHKLNLEYDFQSKLLCNPLIDKAYKQEVKFNTNKNILNSTNFNNILNEKKGNFYVSHSTHIRTILTKNNNLLNFKINKKDIIKKKENKIIDLSLIYLDYISNLLSKSELKNSSSSILLKNCLNYNFFLPFGLFNNNWFFYEFKPYLNYKSYNLNNKNSFVLEKSNKQTSYPLFKSLFNTTTLTNEIKQKLFFKKMDNLKIPLNLFLEKNIIQARFPNKILPILKKKKVFTLFNFNIKCNLPTLSYHKASFLLENMLKFEKLKNKHNVFTVKTKNTFIVNNLLYSNNIDYDKLENNFFWKIDKFNQINRLNILNKSLKKITSLSLLTTPLNKDKQINNKTKYLFKTKFSFLAALHFKTINSSSCVKKKKLNNLWQNNDFLNQVKLKKLYNKKNHTLSKTYIKQNLKKNILNKKSFLNSINETTIKKTNKINLQNLLNELLIFKNLIILNDFSKTNVIKNNNTLKIKLKTKLDCKKINKIKKNKHLKKSLVKFSAQRLPFSEAALLRVQTKKLLVIKKNKISVDKKINKKIKNKLEIKNNINNLALKDSFFKLRLYLDNLLFSQQNGLAFSLKKKIKANYNNRTYNQQNKSNQKSALYTKKEKNFSFFNFNNALKFKLTDQNYLTWLKNQYLLILNTNKNSNLINQEKIKNHLMNENYNEIPKIMKIQYPILRSYLEVTKNTLNMLNFNYLPNNKKSIVKTNNKLFFSKVKNKLVKSNYFLNPFPLKRNYNLLLYTTKKINNNAKLKEFLIKQNSFKKNLLTPNINKAASLKNKNQIIHNLPRIKNEFIPHNITKHLIDTKQKFSLYGLPKEKLMVQKTKITDVKETYKVKKNIIKRIKNIKGVLFVNLLKNKLDKKNLATLKKTYATHVKFIVNSKLSTFPSSATLKSSAATTNIAYFNLLKLNRVTFKAKNSFRIDKLFRKNTIYVALKSLNNSVKEKFNLKLKTLNSLSASQLEKFTMKYTLLMSLNNKSKLKNKLLFQKKTNTLGVNVKNKTSISEAKISETKMLNFLLKNRLFINKIYKKKFLNFESLTKEIQTKTTFGYFIYFKLKNKKIKNKFYKFSNLASTNLLNSEINQNKLIYSRTNCAFKNIKKRNTLFNFFNQLNSPYSTLNKLPLESGQYFYKSNKIKKNLQKKRRALKQRRETGRLLKRKRFFPRPIWLRFMMYKKFLKLRHHKNKKVNINKFNNKLWNPNSSPLLNLKLFKISKLKQNILTNLTNINNSAIKGQDSLSQALAYKNANLNLWKKNINIKNNDINLNLFTSLKEKSEQNLKTLNMSLYYNEQKNSIFAFSTFQNFNSFNKYFFTLSKRISNSLFLPLKNFNMSINAPKMQKNFFSYIKFFNTINFNQPSFYYISKNVLTEFKQGLWKSSWLRANLNAYLRKIKQNFSIIKKMNQKKELNFLTQVSNKTSIPLMLGIPNIERYYSTTNNNQNSTHSAERSFEIEKKNLINGNSSKKLNYFTDNWYLDLNSLISNFEQDFNKALHFFYNFKHIKQNINSKSNEIEKNLINPFNLSLQNLLKWEISLKNAYFSEISYERIQQIITNIKYNLSGINLSNNLNYSQKLKKSIYYDKKQSFIDNQNISPSIINNKKQKPWSVHTWNNASKKLKKPLLKDFSLFNYTTNYYATHASILFTNWTFEEPFFTLPFSYTKGATNVSKQKIYWALNKTNMWLYKNKNKKKYLWANQKSREQNRSNKTKNLINNIITLIQKPIYNAQHTFDKTKKTLNFFVTFNLAKANLTPDGLPLALQAQGTLQGPQTLREQIKKGSVVQNLNASYNLFLKKQKQKENKLNYLGLSESNFSKEENNLMLFLFAPHNKNLNITSLKIEKWQKKEMVNYFKNKNSFAKLIRNLESDNSNTQFLKNIWFNKNGILHEHTVFLRYLKNSLRINTFLLNSDNKKNITKGYNNLLVKPNYNSKVDLNSPYIYLTEKTPSLKNTYSFPKLYYLQKQTNGFLQSKSYLKHRPNDYFQKKLKLISSLKNNQLLSNSFYKSGITTSTLQSSTTTFFKATKQIYTQNLNNHINKSNINNVWNTTFIYLTFLSCTIIFHLCSLFSLASSAEIRSIIKFFILFNLKITYLYIGLTHSIFLYFLNVKEKYKNFISNNKKLFNKEIYKNYVHNEIINTKHYQNKILNKKENLQLKKINFINNKHIKYYLRFNNNNLNTNKLFIQDKQLFTHFSFAKKLTNFSFKNFSLIKPVSLNNYSLGNSKTFIKNLNIYAFKKLYYAPKVLISFFKKQSFLEGYRSFLKMPSFKLAKQNKIEKTHLNNNQFFVHDTTNKRINKNLVSKKRNFLQKLFKLNSKENYKIQKSSKRNKFVLINRIYKNKNLINLILLRSPNFIFIRQGQGFLTQVLKTNLSYASNIINKANTKVQDFSLFNLIKLVSNLKITPIIFTKNKMQLKILSLSLLNSFFKFGLNISYNSYNFVIKLVEIPKTGIQSIYIFLEKPGELLSDWITHLFLIEIASDLTTTIPENTDAALWTNFSKIAKSSALSSVVYAGITPILAGTLEKRLLSSFENLLEILSQPDTDLIIRQKKVSYAWDIWGELLKTVAEKNNINISLLTTKKEDQAFLITKLLDSSAEILTHITPSDNFSSTTLFLEKLNRKQSVTYNFTNKQKNIKINTLFQFLNFSKTQLNLEKFNNQNLVCNALTNLKIKNKNIFNSKKSLIKTNLIWQRWAANQFMTYKGKDSDLFIQAPPAPKSFQVTFKTIKHYNPIQTPIGNIICQIYSGLFYKKTAKNFLVVGTASKNSNYDEKSLLIQSLAGETEMKIIRDNANRYNFALGIKSLRNVFDALALHTPCIFLIEDIHIIGERRPLLVGDDENAKTIQNSSGTEPNDEKNLSIAKITRHVVMHYKKPFRGDYSTTLPTNNYSFDLFLGINSSQRRHFGLTPSSPIILEKENSKHPLNTSNIFIKASNLQFSSSQQESNSAFYDKEKNFGLRKKKEKMLKAPSTTPFSIFLLKEQTTGLNPKKIISETAWIGSSEQSTFISGTSEVPKQTYSIRIKVALLAHLAVSNLSVKLNMITDLLVIIDSVRANRGFVVFATTHTPSILDPALRRPGRLDETIALPFIPKLENRWEIVKSNVIGLNYSPSFFSSSSNKYIFKGITDSGFPFGLTVDLFDYGLFNHSISIFNLQNLKIQEKLTKIKKNVTKNRNYSTQIETKNKQNLRRINEIFIFDNILEPYNLCKGLNQNKSSKKQNKLFNFTKLNLMLNKNNKKTKKWHSNFTSFKENKSKNFAPTIFNNKIMKKSPSTLIATAYSKVASLLINNKFAFNYINLSLFSVLHSQLENVDSQKTMRLPYFYLYSKQENIKQILMNLFIAKVTESFIYSSVSLKNYNNTNYVWNQVNKNYLDNINKGQIIKIKKGAESLFKITSKLSHASIFSKTKNKPKQNFKNNAEKVSNITAAALNNLNLKNQIPNLGLWSVQSVGIDKTWIAGSSLIFSYIEKQLMYKKNLIIPKLLQFYDAGIQSASLHDPPSAPSSFLLLPAKRYENYKRSFVTMQNQNLYSNSSGQASLEKIQASLEKRILKKNLYSLFERSYSKNLFNSIKQNNNETINKINFSSAKKTTNFFNETNKLQQFNFENMSVALLSISKFIENPTSINWYYRNRLLNRHRGYLNNQWWNGQLSEQNVETTFLSDVDWRSNFVSSFINKKSFSKTNQLSFNLNKNKKTNSLSTFQVEPSKLSNSNLKKSEQNYLLDILIDYPDFDQHYNPRNRRWILNYGYWSYWYNYQKDYNKEIYSYMVMETFLKTYHFLNSNREILDYLVAKLIKIGLLKEITIIDSLKRF